MKVQMSRKTREIFQSELNKELNSARTQAEKAEFLCRYRIKEITRMEAAGVDRKNMPEFFEELSDLAETVVESVLLLVNFSSESAGSPKDALKSGVAVFALGDFGAREPVNLSQLELLFVYKNHDDDHAEKLSAMIEEFQAILRGPDLTVDLGIEESAEQKNAMMSVTELKKYLAEVNKSFPLARQALIKWRRIAGDERLGREVEQLRDEFVYGGLPFDFREAFKSRVLEQKNLTAPLQWNVRYSHGGLRDIECLVGSMQIVSGAENSEGFRSPSLLKAMDSLLKAAVIHDKKHYELRSAYLFFKYLVYTLLKSRQDGGQEVIPEENSEEYLKLVRQLGYSGTDERAAGQFRMIRQFHRDIAARFYEDWMSKKSEIPAKSPFPSGHSSKT